MVSSNLVQSCLHHSSSSQQRSRRTDGRRRILTVIPTDGSLLFCSSFKGSKGSSSQKFDMSSCSLSALSLSPTLRSRTVELGAGIPRQPTSLLMIRCQARPKSSSSNEKGRGSGSSKRVWKARKLTRKDPMASYKLARRVPFLEERARNLTENGEIIFGDIERLMLSEENRYQFVNDVAAEAKAYQENNRDEYGHKKAIHHVLTDRMHDYGFSRPEAYVIPDPFKPPPGFFKEGY